MPNIVYDLRFVTRCVFSVGRKMDQWFAVYDSIIDS